ncbi:hypothetical protein BO85DRAFT_200287 [Aspergillus piperis CBS 112811]|uniref:Uncharacterized protein n=1 Tax=Aspergillus piperis CBS 112811 TaxID=1448313 RepID=A0A8G1VHV9_9EURO|nr:hypothetical protein BO85DRAFT_200287 [Aspergillus piperis CBS 112811]RAH52627.1 hypothetical protein BO85DRAFT_200287 [Aspergillus piperis CBS 112811]
MRAVEGRRKTSRISQPSRPLIITHTPRPGCIATIGGGLVTAGGDSAGSFHSASRGLPACVAFPERSLGGRLWRGGKERERGGSLLTPSQPLQPDSAIQRAYPCPE